MILDTRYENNNFKNSNKIFKFLGKSEYFLEMNTKFHTEYSEEYKKQYLFDLKMFFILSDILLVYCLGYSFMYTEFFKNGLLTALYLVASVTWFIYQYFHYNAYKLGSMDNIIENTGVYDFYEYIRYHEISLPVETLPEWITETEKVYSKESFDVIINRLTKEKRFVEFLGKYKRLAFKTNKIIRNNKMILTSWLKEDMEKLDILGIVPVTLVDYKSIWKDQGYSDEDIELMYVDKINELKREED